MLLSGENNVRVNRNKYQCTFPAMIDDWRKKFSASSDTDQLFPFGFVQVAYNVMKGGLGFSHSAMSLIDVY